jgi:putative Ca2+/H+ antiporter (TMEM165/GDT1 family)
MAQGSMASGVAYCTVVTVCLGRVASKIVQRRAFKHGTAVAFPTVALRHKRLEKPAVLTT